MVVVNWWDWHSSCDGESMDSNLPTLDSLPLETTTVPAKATYLVFSQNDVIKSVSPNSGYKKMTGQCKTPSSSNVTIARLGWHDSSDSNVKSENPVLLSVPLQIVILRSWNRNWLTVSVETFLSCRLQHIKCCLSSNCLGACCYLVGRHPFMTSTKKSRFWPSLPLSTCVHMGRTPSPLVNVHTWSTWNTHSPLEMASTMTYRT